MNDHPISNPGESGTSLRYGMTNTRSKEVLARHPYWIPRGRIAQCQVKPRGAQPTKTMNRKHTTFERLRAETRLLALGLLLVILAACSSVKTQVNTTPVKARTFSFLNTGSKPLPGYAEERTQAHAMVQQALKSNLAAKGLDYVPAGGDVTVAYLIIVGNNSTTTSLNSYFGYTADSEALVKKVHSEQTESDSARGYFEAGTLVVDFVDPASSTLLQRRSIQAPVLRDLSEQTRSARLQSIVDQALTDVPVVH